MDNNRYIGKTVKADGRTIAGYLVYFSPDASVRDLDGEYFTKSTEFGFDVGYPVVGDRVLFHHGGYKGVETSVIGKFTAVKVDETGVWAEAVLDDANRYSEHIRRLAAQGKLSWSSGALPGSVIVDNGEIKRWNIIEGSLTPTPAMPIMTRVGVKSLMIDDAIDLLGEGEGGISDTVKQAQETVKSITKESNMDASSIIRAVLDKLAASMSGEEVASLVNDILAAASGEVAEVEAATPEAVMSADTPAFKAAQKLADMTIARVNNIKAAQAAGLFAAQAVNKKQLAGSAVTAAGGGHLNSTADGRTIQYGGAPTTIKNFELKRKWGNLTPTEKSVALYMMDAAQISPSGGSEAMRVIKTMIADEVLADNRSDRVIASKAAHFKANELDNTGQSGFGQDWTRDLWRAELMRKAVAENVILGTLGSYMMDADVEKVPVEWTDPTVYFVAESTDEADMNYNGSNIPMTKVGTKKITLDSKKLALRTGWSAELEEDSIIRYAPQATEQAGRVLREGVDFLLWNGDTTNNNTNINDDSGALTGNELYLATDGVLHLPIITDPTNLAVDHAGAAITWDAIKALRFKLDRNAFNDKSRMVYITHPELYENILSLDELKTQDKWGNRATVNTGDVPVIGGIPLLVSTQFLPSKANGKVSATPANNIYGRIACVYIPYWKVGIRRNFTSYLARGADGESYQLTMTVRLDIQTNPNNKGASLLYDVAL